VAIFSCCGERKEGKGGRKRGKRGEKEKRKRGKERRREEENDDMNYVVMAW
jgi:hypothetical protein